jgi:hypothetical protein
VGKKFLLVILIFLVPAGPQAAAAPPMFELDGQGRVTAAVTNVPFQQVLQNFCATFDLEVKGAPRIDDPINLTISKGTLHETLTRLLRGYNYVFMQDPGSKKPVVYVFGKAERSKHADTSPSSVAPAGPAQSPSPISPAQHTVTRAIPPASPPVQGTATANKTEAADGQRQQYEDAAGPVMASARPVTRQAATVPPSPPQIPGLEMPPIPPTLEEAKAANTSVAAIGTTSAETALERPPQIPAENSSGQTPDEIPPQIPAGESQAQQKPKPKADLSDLTPPSIPF